MNYFALLVSVIILGAGSDTGVAADYAYPSDGGCGGVLEGNNRTLIWTQNPDPGSAVTQCVWTIQPVGRFTLTKFQVLTARLTVDDQLTVTVFTQNYNLVASSVKPHTIVVNTTEPYEYRAAIAFAVVVLRPSNTSWTNPGKFLHMSIESRPPFTASMYEPNDPSYNWHSEEHSGVMRYPKGNPDSLNYLEEELATFVISNPQDALAGNDVLLEVSQADVEFHFSGFSMGRTDCVLDGVLVYEILPELVRVCSSVNCDPWETIGLFGLRDSGVCGRGGGYGYYAKTGYLVIMASDQSNVRTGFEFNWKTIQKLPEPEPVPTPEPTPGAYTLCGGVISDESGVIEYKLNETISPNELCVWTFRASTYRRISFTKEAENGLTVGEDLITITMHRIPYDGYAASVLVEEAQLNAKYAGREVVNLYGTLAVVVFTSRAATGNDTRAGSTGFRLRYRAYKDHEDNERRFTDVGQYGDTGTVSHGGGHTYFFSSFTVAPNTYITEPFDNVQLSVVDFDVWAGDGCSLNSLFLYEIVPASASSDQGGAGRLRLSERLCHTIVDSSYIARRGFFGLLVTTISLPYTQPIVGYTFNYTTVK